MPTLHAKVYERIEHLPQAFSVASLPAMARPRGVLLCPPDDFDITDVRNPFMAGNQGRVDRPAARVQWEALRDAFERSGTPVETVDALAGCEDMVFSANTALFGVDAAGARACIPSRMTFASRAPEVGAAAAWARAHGCRIIDDVGEPGWRFEGSGDAFWHPGRRLVWGGYGWRSDPQIYAGVAAAFGAPVFALALTDSTFYHLDTCFFAVDEKTALVHTPAIAAEGVRLIERAFERVVDVDAAEAARFACNAATLGDGVIGIDRRASKTASLLRELGYGIVELDTGEFIKSGGSAYCMKNAFF